MLNEHIFLSWKSTHVLDFHLKGGIQPNIIDDDYSTYRFFKVGKVTKW